VQETLTSLFRADWFKKRICL